MTGSQAAEMKAGRTLAGRMLVQGRAQAPLLYADVGLSFWGAVDPFTGMVVDSHHPLRGACLAGRILAIPKGRGSCTGSSVMLELILNGHAPAGLILAEPDEILVLGVVVANFMFGRSLPVICVGHDAFATLEHARSACMADGCVMLGENVHIADPKPAQRQAGHTVSLSAYDRSMLDGAYGKAAQAAMNIVLEMAALQNADRLIDIGQAHIDGCIYTGPASLRFARQFVEWGAKVRVPTTLNSISVDQRRWRAQGVDPSLGDPAAALGNAYVEMGAQPSFTCAPYLLDGAPARGEQIVWAESNAVAFANSVLGARTLKYPDYLDLCVALTGRAPFVGTHCDSGRHGTVHIAMQPPDNADESFFPLLGYHIGLLSSTEIPVVSGLQDMAPDRDALKAFSAAFATTSAAPMFHIVGVTPEAPTVQAALGHKPARREYGVRPGDLVRSWQELDSAAETTIQLVSLGNPHLSLEECGHLAALCNGRVRHDGTEFILTMGREIHDRASAAGYIKVLEAFGAQIITDTCWCMIGEPVIPRNARTLMTNSGKYAHYAPGLVGRQVRFGSLAACVDAAETGTALKKLPVWLMPPG